MDIIFKCPNCEQELEVDASGAGSEIECPACSKTLTVPYPDPGAVPTEEAVAAAPPPPPPPPKEEKHFTVPVHATAPATLIKKSTAKPLDVVAKEGGMRIKTIRHSDCRDGAKDNFDDTVSELLEKIGQANVVSVSPIGYSLKDAVTNQILNDYGVIVVFKG